jgi:hypothetical protein
MEKYREYFANLRGRLLSGQISYDVAKIESAPHIDEMNAIGYKIAKKHGKRFYSFSFSSLIR